MYTQSYDKGTASNFSPVNFSDTLLSGKAISSYVSDIKSEKRMGYTQIPEKFYHPKPARNALGLVGGNAVSIIDGPMVDLESDLRGITRATTKCNARQWNPECPLGGDEPCGDWPSGITYLTKDTLEKRNIPLRPIHMPTIQMNSYQGTPYPHSFSQGTGTPYRF